MGYAEQEAEMSRLLAEMEVLRAEWGRVYRVSEDLQRRLQIEESRSELRGQNLMAATEENKRLRETVEDFRRQIAEYKVRLETAYGENSLARKDSAV